MSQQPILINSVGFWTIKQTYTCSKVTCFFQLDSMWDSCMWLCSVIVCAERQYFFECHWMLRGIFICSTVAPLGFLFFFSITSSVVHSSVFMLLHCIYLNQNCWVVHHTHIELYWVMPIFFFKRNCTNWNSTHGTGIRQFTVLCSLHLGHMAFSFFFFFQLKVCGIKLSNNG